MSVTRLTLLAVAAGVALVLGCGEGRVIFNVDLLSFLDAGEDTIHYPSPIPPVDTIKNPPILFRLPPGLGGKGTVDTVAVTVGTYVVNSSGSGQVSFQIFFASDAATLYSGTPYSQASLVVNSGDSLPLVPPTIPVIGDPLFTNDSLYFGVRVSVASGMTGRLRLSTVQLRIVLQEKIF
jgi:hypothetical protein